MSLLVEKKIFDKRIKSCSMCNKYKNSRCSVCGCFMHVKAWIHRNMDGKLVTCPHPEGNKWKIK